jgi:hypothetical protein
MWSNNIDMSHKLTWWVVWYSCFSLLSILMLLLGLLHWPSLVLHNLALQWKSCYSYFSDKIFAGTVCSGHGVCEYSDPSGGILNSCTVLETSCAAACLCDTGFGGADCSFSAAETTQRDTVRWLTMIDESAVKKSCIFKHLSHNLISLLFHVLGRLYVKRL